MLAPGSSRRSSTELVTTGRPQGTRRGRAVHRRAAGNQSCIIPQYPAAFQGPDHPNVIGVASVDPGGAKSEFTNYGGWVSCSAVGRDVVSTFLNGYNGETEDSDDPENPVHATKAFDTGWARWSGTSFAAPKVAGDLAERHATGTSMADAWNDLKKTGAAQPGLGVVLPL